MSPIRQEVAIKKVQRASYNILPLHASGAIPAIMELPEIRVAVKALRDLDNLPKIRRVDGSSMFGTSGTSAHDLLDWLGLVFGFQKGNVENQREHLIFLLANIDGRDRNQEEYTQLSNRTVTKLKDKVFQNYLSWCKYLRTDSEFPNAATQQLELLYIGLYFLIWGEASNIRFMPECLCYIFHKMAQKLNGIVHGNEPTHHGEETFLKDVVTPIYQLMRKEAGRNKNGHASHSKWGNYDDLNEYFWSRECLDQKWPMQHDIDTSVPTEGMHTKDEAMLIIAWSPLGSISAVFHPDVFRSVLSIFITAALLNFLQATLDLVLSWKAWGSLQYTQIIRYLLKFAVAAAWVPRLYVGRGMHEGMFSLFKYTLFWILLLISKLAFSYYVEISPLVEPTKQIMDLRVGYEWHQIFPNLKHNLGIVISIWAPIVLDGSNRKNIAKFFNVWNAFISSLRLEDLISNSEKDLLLVPSSSDGKEISVVQWPPFLLASKIPTALGMAKDFKGKDDAGLFNKIKYDDYMSSAVIECYQTLKVILRDLLVEEEGKEFVKLIDKKVDASINSGKFLNNFQMSELPQLNNKLERLLNLLKEKRDNTGPQDVVAHRRQIIKVVQDMMEIIAQDIIINDEEIAACWNAVKDRIKYGIFNVNLDLLKNESWGEKVVRLHLLLSVKESAINVPMNLDARRRITFFANSLFMKMPHTPQVRKMLSFSVLTPYYKEEVLYSEEELNKKNEDGISTLFYLRKIYPDEWNNFREREFIKDGDSLEGHMDAVRHWVSYRAQTLSRTVRGMMYYRKALQRQGLLDMAENQDILGGHASHAPEKSYHDQLSQAVADMKFTYVVSCQVFGMQQKSTDIRDKNSYQNIVKLLLKYPSLRVAYIDEVEDTTDEKTEKVYYSVLVKGDEGCAKEIYRIKLPGPPTAIGEGKPENQNHAIIFTRGEALQTIDMNQDNYLEEAFKIRNVLAEFLEPHHGPRLPTILGLREHIFTGRLRLSQHPSVIFILKQR
ncbi:hypothetical protein J5N97_019469 [Dioscorea zingiberensis]|uniref:1,3-beta-glucan synthase n=1 Tax=Dioscorea zingiberensis TaxID=325984 RepID=A0A9D5CET4_9LILI|nr:hypothetical protein J5N97_019469 [Dioscorea zingiberensis]